MVKIVIVAIIVIVGTLLSGSIDQPTYREPNEIEVNHFIPYGYQLISDNQDSDPQIVKANLDGDTELEFLLPLRSTDGESPVKILIIKYDPVNDNWGLLYSLEYNDFVSVGVVGTPTDLDNDNINEIHLAFVPYSATGFTNGNSLMVLTNRNDEIVDLMPQNAHFDFCQLDDGKVYKTAFFIWQSDEGHFDCHYFTLETYGFSETNFELLSTYTTKNKYNIDTGFPIEDCADWNIYQEML